MNTYMLTGSNLKKKYPNILWSKKYQMILSSKIIMELQAPLLLSHAPSAIELVGKGSQLGKEYLPTKVSNHTLI